MIELNEDLARQFLVRNNIANYEIKKVAGDASFRSYYRIFTVEKAYILMFAPPSHEDIRPFEKVAKFLTDHEFSAPRIFARDEENGFLLLEDLGDDTYGRVLAKSVELELPLYEKACDCLIELHKAPLLSLPVYNHALLFREVMLFVDWYLPHIKKSMTLAQKAHFKFLWFQLFDLLDRENQTVVLRDFHADNLMTLPNRAGYKQVGLLDFQDAVIGSKAYDLVSLLEDARRDVNEENRVEIFNYYLQKSGCDKEKFSTDYAILSLQRNIKIVGIFARLSVRDGKHHYLNLLPRVLDLVKQRAFSDNANLFEIGKFLKNFL